MTLVPSKNVLKLWRFTVAVIFAAVFSAFCYLPFVNDKVKFIAAIFSAALLCLVIFIYQPLLYKGQKIIINSNFIIVTKGAIIKREYVYPNLKAVYIKYYILPLHSCFGLQVAVIKGVGNSLLLPPLTENQQKILKEAMINEK